MPIPNISSETGKNETTWLKYAGQPVGLFFLVILGNFFLGKKETTWLKYVGQAVGFFFLSW